jgi:hypothetical protein
MKACSGFRTPVSDSSLANDRFSWLERRAGSSSLPSTAFGRGLEPIMQLSPCLLVQRCALKTIVGELRRGETELCACAFGNVAVELCQSARPRMGLVPLALSGHEFIP